VEPSSVLSELASVKDVFQVKEQYKTGHEPGLVVVLDRLVSTDPNLLLGKVALISTPNGKSLHVRIDDAREHGTVNSLFFNSLELTAVPVGSRVEIQEKAERLRARDNALPVQI
jgi:hypothetical protein